MATDWLAARHTHYRGWFYVERTHVEVYTDTVRSGIGSIKLTAADLRRMVNDLKKRTATKVRDAKRAGVNRGSAAQK